VINTVLYGYLIGWVVTWIGLVLTGRQEPRPSWAVVVAGAAWPVLLVGVAQFLAIALIAEAARTVEPDAESVEDELEALLAEWATDETSTPERRFSFATGGDSAR
jgi:hypothetical protein